MTDSSMAARLSALRADLAKGRPEVAEPAQAAERPVCEPPPEAATGLDPAAADGWVRAHPITAVALCLVAGAVVGGLLKRGRGR
ncbi:MULTISPECIES: hypothetical protein [unclassified Xanthobacter]|uniref:hypothetical protein n=1 Tax=unclassified Xanthobacter TaxID=2623496 RepID=UPI001F1BB126|nr:MULTISPECIES: hypothetical protein [unclassified Xanthobacter]